MVKNKHRSIAANYVFFMVFFSSESEAEYIPDQCHNQKCVTLLSGHQADTFFVTEHIDELKLHVKVIWFGDNLRYVTRMLLKQFSDKPRENRKAFVVVHWTPSEIIDGDIEYETITMPKCEQFNSEDSKNTMCKYELTPILKYRNSKPLKKSMPVYSLFSIINLERNNETYLLQMYNNMTDLQMPPQRSEVMSDKSDINNFVDDKILNNASEQERIYDEIACRFIREEEQTFRSIVNLPGQMTREKRQVFIGGIYPKKEEAENEHFGEKIGVMDNLCIKIFIGTF